LRWRPARICLQRGTRLDSACHSPGASSATLISPLKCSLALSADTPWACLRGHRACHGADCLERCRGSLGGRCDDRTGGFDLLRNAAELSVPVKNAAQGGRHRLNLGLQDRAMLCPSCGFQVGTLGPSYLQSML
jgi:hypothetical protein